MPRPNGPNTQPSAPGSTTPGPAVPTRATPAPAGGGRWFRGPGARARVARLGAQGAVLALVAGGTTAFAVLHTSVTVDVDGTPVEVTAFARTVGDVLDDAGIEAGPRDLVAPALDAPVRDGGEIVVRHGREVTVEVDGEPRTVWTTALTVGEAVADLGLRGDGARVSASRSSALGRDVLQVSTRKAVQVAVDGEVVDASTTAPTVREALRETGLVLAEGDHVSVPLDAAVEDGLEVVVTRAVHGTATVVEELPFTETVVEDPTLLEGERRVQTPGQAGRRQTTYAVTTVGGTEVSRSVVAEVVVSEPVQQVVQLGTMPPPPPPPPVAARPRASAPSGSAAAQSSAPSAPVSVDPGSAQGIAREMVLARGWGEDQFSCLVKLWHKESGWRVTADNPSSSAYGIPQALPGSKMASAGADWRTNPATQIRWGLGYIDGRYGTPCAAWGHSQARNWY
ncbi:ubiquitin-like domain-containing protein [Cellulomonas sp. ATA003]|uniref:aggregation-promoting factor C-terminal-like domain-containing protein n=1 Tax=Cellulomonas sp. ATA003 TaxID=3073064 RepID=UPI002872D95D|nr:ubiquitin-like domain-containing protein [Cellulomonas sp. ATA003]WNB85095.1 ubiquitin-like domain-containing protein [Cellulomonas sp. ATA003]